MTTTMTKPSPAGTPKVVTDLEPRYDAGKLIQRYADGLAQLAGVGGMGATQWVAEAIDAADRFYLANRGKSVIAESVLRAIKNGAGMGLSFNATLGQLYLVPFKNGEFTKRNGRDTYEAQLIVGYQGMEALAYGTNWLDTLYVDCVLESELRDDRFQHWVDEQGPHIKHTPHLGRSVPRSIKDKDQIALGYAVWKTKSGNFGCAVADKARIARAVNPRSDMWKFDVPSGVKKTTVREAFKHWPKSLKIGTALHLDDMAEIGHAQQDVSGLRLEQEGVPAIEGPAPGEVAGLGEDIRVPDDPEMGPPKRSETYTALLYRIETSDEKYDDLRGAVGSAAARQAISEAERDELTGLLDSVKESIPY